MFVTRALLLSLLVFTTTIAGTIAEDTTPLPVKIATHSHLNDATALANKNTVTSNQNVAVTRSNIRAQQDDVVTGMTDNQEQTTGEDATQPKDAPSGLVLMSDQEPLQGGTETDEDDKKEGDDELMSAEVQPPSDLKLTGERDMLKSPEVSDDTEMYQAEQFIGYRRRFFYPGFRGGYFGWRYPLPYWRRFGRRFYPGVCPFGRVYGGYFYC